MVLEIPVMVCFDNNYWLPAGVALYSMLKHANARYKYKIYVCHTDITETNQSKIRNIVAAFSNAELEFINMHGKFDQEFKKLSVRSHYSKEVLYKLLVGTLFPQHDRLIITDVDVIFMGDISKHYIDLLKDDNFVVAGVRPVNPKDSVFELFYQSYKFSFSDKEIKKLNLCGGYLIYNLKNLRENNKQIEKDFEKCLMEKSKLLLQAEQDVINLVVPEDKKRFLPLNALVCSYFYDVFTYQEDFDTDAFYSGKEIKHAMQYPIQLHYATPKKPWRNPEITKSDIWFKYLYESGLTNDWLQYISKFTIPLQNKNKTKIMRLPQVFRRQLSVLFKIIKYPKFCKESDISVICLTYNQEKTIRKTLDGFVMQKCSLPVKVIVSDDGSSDKTPDIIREYAKKYPNLIKAILHKRNRGVAENAYSVAWCDGDDYWLDEFKLEKQLSVFKKHPDCNIVCSDVKWHYMDNSKPDCVFKVRKYMPRHMAKKDDFDFDDLLKCRFIASCTAMIRWQIPYGQIPNWIKNHVVVDFPIMMIHAHNGKIRVMKDVLAQYNISSAGVSQQSQTLEYKYKMRDILQLVDQYLNFEHTKSINKYLEETKDY